MISVKLDFNEIKILLECVKDVDYSGKSLTFELKTFEKESITELMELVADKLINVGFDENWSPNKNGYALESLIDKLSSSL